MFEGNTEASVDTICSKEAESQVDDGDSKSEEDESDDDDIEDVIFEKELRFLTKSGADNGIYFRYVISVLSIRFLKMRRGNFFGGAQKQA